MADKSTGSKGKPTGAGRRKGRFEAMFGRCEARKINRVQHHNGRAAAKALTDFFWAKKFGKETVKYLTFEREQVMNNAARDTRFNRRREKFGPLPVQF